jgi:predicted phosphoribosyltransferase
MRFPNRTHVAELLADRLERYREDRPLVLGIPRGGVPMGAVIADRLGADLDVMLVHKLRAPFQRELAVGAVDEAGHVYRTWFGDDYVIDPAALDAEVREQIATLAARRRRYTGARQPVALAGRVVILVDDGLATGSTALAAVKSARDQGAARVIVAVGVAPPSTVAHLRAEADDVVCLQSPPEFSAVGQFFEDFSDVSDEDVMHALEQHRRGDVMDSKTPDPDVALVPVLATTEFGLVPLARAALEQAGIDYMIRDTGLSNEIMGQRSTMSIGETGVPVQVLVRAEDEAAARDVLRDFGAATA